MPSTATAECKLHTRCSDAAIRAARLSPRLEAAQHLLKQSNLPSSLPSSRLLCLPLSGARLCLKAAHSCSDCACLPAFPDKLLLCMTVIGPLTRKKIYICMYVCMYVYMVQKVVSRPELETIRPLNSAQTMKTCHLFLFHCQVPNVEHQT